MDVTPSATDTRTLGESHRLPRLEARAARVEQVVAALEERVQGCEAAGWVPEPLHLAVSGFRAELDELRGRLATAHADGSGAPEHLRRAGGVVRRHRDARPEVAERSAGFSALWFRPTTDGCDG